jgi:fatty-acyl-CoA synthase
MSISQGVGTWIERRARAAPDRIALVFGDVHRTYEELAGRVRRLANQLRALGVNRADRVGWLGPNHPAFLEILFAAAKIGAVLAPINHRLERGAVEAICDDVGPRVVFRDESVPDLDLPSGVAAQVTVGTRDAQESQYERLVGEGPDEPIDESIAFDELCFLPFTSGTTGAPKGTC